MDLVLPLASDSSLTLILQILQANELELALDVYNQLLREGCQPNLVTYNILIDIYGKMGSWQEAVQVLDALEGQVSMSHSPLDSLLCIRPCTCSIICH